MLIIIIFTLQPDDLSKACYYKDSSGNLNQVPWHYPNDKNDYKPSSNIGPRDYLPIIASGAHFKSEKSRILIPMLWGMIPSSWMEDPKKHRASTHNARLETIEETMYKNPLAKGCRCIVVVEGIYEWKTTGSSKFKQPYCIYKQQKEDIKIENQKTWTNEWNEKDGWQGVSVLKMAGLFKTTKNSSTGEVTYSFTVITRESNQVLAWLHHRMPIFLNDPEDEEIWLNYSKYNKIEALNRITKMSLINGIITWHPVSTNVNDVRNKQSDLIKPVESMDKNEQKEEEKTEKSKNFMLSWLKGTNETKRKSDANGDNNFTSQKKPKI